MSISTIQLLTKIEIKDKNGKTRLVIEKPSKSLVIGFLKGLYAIFFALQNVSVTDTSDSAENIIKNTVAILPSIFSLVAGAGIVTSGIVVGTDSTAPDNTDNKLGTLIAHGSAATQMEYGAVTYVPTAEVGANVDLQVMRPILNNSGSSITVEEYGMYIKTTEVGGAYAYVCIARDITGGTVVANGETITITYTFRTTV